MKPKKSTSKRSKSKYPALSKHLNLKSRQELIDYDYLDKLNPKELEFLNKFTEEYVNDNMDRKNLKKNLHNTKALKKDCDDKNNSRNRDIFNRAKVNNDLVPITDLSEEELDEQIRLFRNWK